MKTTLKLVGLCLAVFLLAGLLIAFHRQALNRAQQENQLLHQQINELMAQSEQLAAENARLSSALAVSRTNTGTVLLQEPSREVLQLRGEVGRLRLQYRELEQTRRDEAQAARPPSESAELQTARAQFAKVQQRYREGHPKYQEALHIVQTLEKQQTTQ